MKLRDLFRIVDRHDKMKAIRITAVENLMKAIDSQQIYASIGGHVHRAFVAFERAPFIRKNWNVKSDGIDTALSVLMSTAGATRLQ